MKNFTKILSLGVLLLFACSMQLSAQKCNLNYNKKDPITGEETKRKLFSITGFWEIEFNKIGESYFLKMGLSISGNIREILQKGESAIFKLSNGEIITIYTQEESLPVAQIAADQIFTRYNTKYEIDAITLQKMIEFPPTFIRTTAGSKIFEKNLSGGDTKRISQTAKCIL